MLAPGTRLGPYEVLSPLGAGGMGEVYRARDTRLGRDVAVKVLPTHLSDNAEVRARFEREAKTVSSLNHPHICTLFDVGREGETDYLVMELVEGETLADRLKRGPMPAAELLRLGGQIADALDRAHRAGVIHRDLKPGNVMLTRAGAKLMDFGLARATGLAGPASGSGATLAALTQTPTVAHALTAEGTLLGTFQYMSPEQLEGKEADVRSDIWALGCVLYEMASARRAFEGRSQASLIAAILEREPARLGEQPGSGAPPSGSSRVGATAIPAGLDGLIRDCLAKDPDERIQTAHDVRLRLQRIASDAGFSSSSASLAGGAPAADAAIARSPRAAALPWAIAALAVIAAAAFGAWAWPQLTAKPQAFRFKPEISGANMVDPNWPRLSPDGRALVFEAADTTGVERAFLLRLDDTQPKPILGSEKLSRAYWSPDSKEIVFVADAKLQRLPVEGGTPRIVCPAPGGSDVSWGAKGFILMDGSTTDSLQVVPAVGGELHPATRIEHSAHETGSAWPCFLPDGEHFVYIGTRNDGATGNIRLGKLGSLDSKLLGSSDGRVEWAPGNWLLYVRGSSLVAQKLDLGAGKLTGQPITIVDDLRVGASSGHFTTSRTGLIALQRGSVLGGLEMHLADRAGRVAPAVLTSGALANPHFSPDGRRVLYESKAVAQPWGDVAVYDLDRSTNTPLTFTNGRAVRSQWSPDGRRFAYTRITSDTRSDFMIGSADGLGAQDSLAAPGGAWYLSQWAAAGNRLLAYSGDRRVAAVPADGANRAMSPLAGADLRLANPQISPDGRWVAGTIPGDATYNVFVQSLAGPSGRWQISPTSGGRVVWTKGGHELVYETADGKLMAVAIDTRDGGFHPGTPQQLFLLPLPSFTRELSTWTVDATGERFLLVTLQHTRIPERTVEIVTRFQSLVEGR